MEACGRARHWARTLQTRGHEVKLLPAKHVRVFMLRDKTDARDAQAIWVAAQQPHIKAVSVKNEQQQDCLTSHARSAHEGAHHANQRSARVALRVGIVLPQGHRAVLKLFKDALAKAQEQALLPEVVVASVEDQLRSIDSLQCDIDQLDKRLAAMVKQNQHMLALLAIPGIGPLTATALVSTTTDLSSFESGRQFAAWLGLTRVVVAALANKLALTVWVVLVKGFAFDQVKWNPVDLAAS